MVRLAGVEPAHPKALPPEDSASAIPPQPHEICSYCITFGVACQIRAFALVSASEYTFESSNCIDNFV